MMMDPQHDFLAESLANMPANARRAYELGRQRIASRRATNHAAAPEGQGLDIREFVGQPIGMHREHFESLLEGRPIDTRRRPQRQPSTARRNTPGEPRKSSKSRKPTLAEWNARIDAAKKSMRVHELDDERRERQANPFARIAATHEAGHVVVAREFGVVAECVGLANGGDDGFAYLHTDAAPNTVCAAVGIGGAVAECVCRGEPTEDYRRYVSAGDRATMRKHGCTASDERIAFSMAARTVEKRQTEINAMADQLLQDGEIEF